MRSPQFNSQYEIAPRQADNPGSRKRSAMIINQQQDAFSRVRRRPANIAFFESAVRGELLDGDRPLVGYFCNMIPVELITALGARAVRLDCGNAALVQTGEEVLSGDVCPLAKSAFANLLDPQSVASRCVAFVLPTSCDAKRKMGQILADYRPTFMLNLPPEQHSGRYTGMMAAEIERLGKFLSEHLKERLARKQVKHAIEAGYERTRVVRQLEQARADHPAALSIRDFHLIIQASFSGIDLQDWTQQARLVLAETATFEPTRERLRHRLVLTGAPMIWPNFKLLNLIEECGGDVVADTLCSGGQSCFDPVMVDERGWQGLYRAFALRYVFASPCPAFISQDIRINRILDLVKETHAAGVVNYGLRLCQLFDVETYRLTQILKDRKIPLLTMRTDYSLEDTEQLRVRLEAFLETLEDE